MRRSPSRNEPLGDDATPAGLGRACPGSAPASTRLGVLAAAAIVSSSACGGAPPTIAARATAKTSAAPWKLSAPKSRVLPDVVGPRGLLGGVLVKPSVDADAGEQRILGRMRIVTREGGIIERASDLLPAGRVSAVELPSRLGGGYVFTLINGRGTQVWRAKTWLAKLAPLVEVSTVADGDGPVVVGFDRIYLRMKSQNDLVAIDPETGKAVGMGSLPVAPAYGEMVFVDGWRAVVETDLRGVLATFDAGATWKHLPIKERVKSIGEDKGDPVITVEGGEYRLSARGQLSFAAAQKTPAGVVTPITASTLDTRGVHGKPVSPLGKKPLRAALEDGYPDGERTAVVVRGGAIGRVSLDDGRVLSISEHVLPETTTCHGIRLGPSFGFVCGEPSGPTTIYQYAAPLELHEVMRFDEPRLVTESGQGAIVVTGSCARKSDPEEPGASTSKKDPARSFCVRSAAGAAREIRVRGDLGAERVVAMGDGRVVVLVPPRPGAMGQLSIIDGSKAKHVALKLPSDGPLRELESGMWLEGFQESTKDELGGWVEAGGPVVGIRVKLDGTVTAGQVVEEDGGVLVSGPFGLAVGARGRALETLDGGLSWRDIELPVLDGAGPQNDERTRRCGPVGCALNGILRVGWGEPAVPDDLGVAPDPEPLKTNLGKLTSAPLGIECGVAAPVKAPTPRAASPAKSRPAEPPPKKGAAAPKRAPSASTASGSWSAFRGVDAPPLGADEVGIDNGAPFDVTPMRAYVWGKRDSDWSRTGRYQMKFGDRFAPDEVRASAISAAPWADETAASEAFGVGAYGYSVTWSAFADPAGNAAIVSACRGRPCALYGVEQDRPVLPLRAARDAGVLTRPLGQSTVRVGESWFFLSEGTVADRLSLFRSDLGTVRLLTEIPRPHAPRFVQAGAPRLVRRAKGGGIGLFVVTKEPGERKGHRWVLPLDPDTGLVGDPIDLGKNDLALAPPSTCPADRDGWLVVVTAGDPAADVTAGGSRMVLDGVELRMRIDPGYACVEAAAATTDRDPPSGEHPTKAEGSKPDGKGEGAKGERAAFSFLVAQRSSGKRYALRCSVR